METTKPETGLQINARIATMTGFSPEEVGVIKGSIAKGTTDTELAYFLQVCKNVNLNPFLKQVWCFKDNKGNLLIFAGRDGYLEIAQRDQRWTGMSSAYVCEKDQFTMDVPKGIVKHTFGIDRGKIIGAYCIIRPKGLKVSTVEWAELDEYKPKNASVYSPWSNTPGIMIQKCAEVHALKKAFGISGLNSEDDFSVINNVAVPVQELNKPEINKEHERIQLLIEDCKTIDDLKNISKDVPEELQGLWNQKLEQIDAELEKATV